MSLFSRVFAASDAVPGPAGIEACLAGPGVAVGARFDEDDSGWYRAELTLGGGAPLVLERWLADEEGIRAELASWAAYLETLDYSPNAGPLMERAIQARQLFTLRRPIDHPNEALLERACQALCQHLAKETAGFYQADDRGFFAADGGVLVQEY
jgi:hypothetical protein